MKIKASLLICLALAISQFALGQTSNQQNIFEYGSPGNEICYRIPAIATAHNGTVISVADYRYCAADIGFGRVSLHARLSKDNGKTWGEKQVIVEAHEGEYGRDKADDPEAGFGDPAIVADSESGNVLLLSCCGNVTYQAGTREHHQGIARFLSTDNGETWSKYENIAPAIYKTFYDNNIDVAAMFVGSGRIFQSRIVKVGKFHRIYAVVLVRTPKVHGLNYIIYSDDFGKNWDILGHTNEPGVTEGDEPKAEELPDGSVLLSSRGYKRIFNIFRYSNVARGEGQWMKQAKSESILSIDNACNGEIMILPVVRKADGKKIDLALQSVPRGPGRSNVSIYYKPLETIADYATPADFAEGWEGHLQVTKLPSAYSTMALQHDGNIGFLYEELTYGGNYAYTIVYMNLSIEEITGGKYAKP